VKHGTRLVILGKQGAGKGTQAERLARHYGVPRISTGDMFRLDVRSGSEAGKIAKQYMDAGELVPDDVVVALVGERLQKDDARDHGFVLDGFPRNVRQASALDEMLAPDGVDLTIELDVPTGVVLKRLAGRRTCVGCGTNYGPDALPQSDSSCDLCGDKVVVREDDTEAAIARRLALYDQETEPLVAWYLGKDKLAPVDGQGALDTVTARLLRAVESRLGPRSPTGRTR
jgi:adenylate kinase